MLKIFLFLINFYWYSIQNKCSDLWVLLKIELPVHSVFISFSYNMIFFFQICVWCLKRMVKGSWKCGWTMYANSACLPMIFLYFGYNFLLHINSLEGIDVYNFIFVMLLRIFLNICFRGVLWQTVQALQLMSLQTKRWLDNQYLVILVTKVSW